MDWSSVNVMLSLLQVLDVEDLIPFKDKDVQITTTFEEGRVHFHIDAETQEICDEAFDAFNQQLLMIDQIR